MSDVVIRCPNCGTTQSALGECEACHEAAVRYYCPNHTPGRWLDAPACPGCGARVGGRGRTPTPPRPSPRPSARPSPRPAPPPSPPPRPPRRSPPPPLPEERRVEFEEPIRWPTERGWPGTPEPRVPEPRAPEPLWPEPRRPEPRWPDAPPLPTVRVRFGSVAGCLGRLVLLALFLLVLAGLAFFWTIGAFAPFAPEPGPWVEAAAAAEWTPSG